MNTRRPNLPITTTAMSDHSKAEPERDSRTATVACNGQEPIGVCLFVSADELRHLGIDPEQTSDVAYDIDPEHEQVNLEGRDSDAVYE